MNELVEIARPKINLTLRILGRRADGYHALESIVAFANGPCDRVALDPGGTGGITVSGPFAGGIAGPNLVQTVIDLVAEAAQPGTLRSGHVHLEKNLPVAGGVGGGSADAGALLRALRRANPDLAKRVDWRAMALRLGADVPVCLLNQAAWMTGIGERVEPLAALPPLPAVLVNPQVPVPADKTVQVFRALRAGPLDETRTSIKAPPEFACADQLIAMIDGGNDLEAAARTVVPAIGDVLAALRAMPGCRVAAMSGAGPTCFGVFGDPVRVADDLSERHPHWWARAATLQ